MIFKIVKRLSATLNIAPMAARAWFTIVGYCLAGALSLNLACIFAVLTYRWHRRSHELLGIRKAHCAETATLAAALGLNALSMAGLVVFAIAREDKGMIVALALVVWTASVWGLVASEIPPLLIFIMSVLAIIVSACMLYTIFPYTNNYMSLQHPLLVWLMVNGLPAVVTALTGLHWRTREDLILKISKAEKKIQKAKRWFFFSQADTV